MTGLESLNTVMSTLADNYKSTYGVQASGNDLILYAKLNSPIQTSIFSTLDQAYDGDNNNNNSITANKYFTDGNNLIFSRADNSLVLYNMPTQKSQNMPANALQAIVAPDSPEWLTTTSLYSGNLIVNQFTLGAGSSPVQDRNVAKLKNNIDLSTKQGVDLIKAICNNYLNYNSDLQDLSAIFGGEQNAAFGYNVEEKCAFMDVVQSKKAFRVKYNEDSKSIAVNELKKEDLLTEQQIAQGKTVSGFRIDNGKLLYDISGELMNPFS